ncbi:MAG: FmdB family zinc ribbon protein [Chloroflexota bacterium]
MYRREDGSTFTIRQKFSDDPLTVDPETGQMVQRIVQSAGIIFKGAGFYVNDSRGSKASLNGASKNGSSSQNGSSESAVSSADTTSSSDTKSEKAASA